ncbi:T9SS type B sorting domain-containing protein [Aureibacter tunicatorum]|uniref:Gliding motility-associated-like protein n=1 Tax=Aureibacter tunicatorum TaxID=866807 RepID=A0AAE3XQF4_9BACT|nr:gliding motility-associated C-terminal domain-containing protein [Aureibacter tunicatorum]MDR6241232.1 gliding motility-associated-like protein [Aureibacter tunicatorum]BDD03492.1 hypothetical protein AUTU_09750 [Aureibacter tunicatorum]
MRRRSFTNSCRLRGWLLFTFLFSSVLSYAQFDYGVFDILEPPNQYVCDPNNISYLETDFEIVAPNFDYTVPVVTSDDQSILPNGNIVVEDLGIVDPKDGTHMYRIKATAVSLGVVRLAITTSMNNDPNYRDPITKEFAVKFGGGKQPDECRLIFSSQLKMPNQTNFNSNLWDLVKDIRGPVIKFFDIDGDGDQDCFVGSTIGSNVTSKIYFFENLGGGQFAPADEFKIVLPEPSECFSNKYHFPAITMGDLDNDGDLDVLVGYNRVNCGSERGGILYFENVTPIEDRNDASKIRFQYRGKNPFGLPDSFGAYFRGQEFNQIFPSLEDVDGDGDLDLFISSGTGSYHYYENHAIDQNTGAVNIASPNWNVNQGSAQAIFRNRVDDPFGLPYRGGNDYGEMPSNVEWDVTTHFVDIDQDGDLDLVWGDTQDRDGDKNGIGYFENFSGKCKVPTFQDAAGNVQGKLLYKDIEYAEVHKFQTVFVGDVFGGEGNNGDGNVELFTGRRGDSGASLSGVFVANQPFSAHLSDNGGALDPEWCIDTEIETVRFIDVAFDLPEGVSVSDVEFQAFTSNQRVLPDANVVWQKPIDGTDRVMITRVPNQTSLNDIRIEMIFKLRDGVNQCPLANNRLKVTQYWKVVNCSEAGDISGKIFEDVDYNGGQGTAFDPLLDRLVNGVRVELYKENGQFVATATTQNDPVHGDGYYKFAGYPVGKYHVRVVNSTVDHPDDPAALPVQTFRMQGDNGALQPVGNRVGGEDPYLVDADENTNNTPLVSLTNNFKTPQSLSTVVIADANGVEGVDFGFSYSVIVNPNSNDQGSLNQFITNANLINGTQTSYFEIRQKGSYQYQPGDDFIIDLNGIDLPEILAPIVLDAFTQQGSSADINYGEHDIRIEIEGNNITGSILNLGDDSDGSTIKGFSLTNNTNGISAISVNSESNSIESNFIGLAMDGLTAKPNLLGITVDSDNVMIGGADLSKRNVISGNMSAAIMMEGDDNVIQNNTIGANKWLNILLNTPQAVPNNVLASQRNVKTRGAVMLEGSGHKVLDNNIAGNWGNGVLINGVSDLEIYGNGIGVINTPDGGVVDMGNGDTDPNVLANQQQSGIFITATNPARSDRNQNIVIGGLLAGDGKKNTIANNVHNGIAFDNDPINGWFASDKDRHVSILANSIYNNGDLGIDLQHSFSGVGDPGQGHTEHDANTIDVNYPVFTLSAIDQDGNVSIQLKGLPADGENDQYYALLFYANDDYRSFSYEDYPTLIDAENQHNDPANDKDVFLGEGRVFLSAIAVTGTQILNNPVFKAPITEFLGGPDVDVQPGKFITGKYVRINDLAIVDQNTGKLKTSLIDQDNYGSYFGASSEFSAVVELTNLPKVKADFNFEICYNNGDYINHDPSVPVTMEVKVTNEAADPGSGIVRPDLPANTINLVWGVYRPIPGGGKARLYHQNLGFITQEIEVGDSYIQSVEIPKDFLVCLQDGDFIEASAYPIIPLDDESAVTTVVEKTDIEACFNLPEQNVLVDPVTICDGEDVDLRLYPVDLDNNPATNDTLRYNVRYTLLDADKNLLNPTVEVVLTHLQNNEREAFLNVPSSLLPQIDYTGVLPPVQESQTYYVLAEYLLPATPCKNDTVPVQITVNPQFRPDDFNFDAKNGVVCALDDDLIIVNGQAGNTNYLYNVYDDANYVNDPSIAPVIQDWSNAIDENTVNAAGYFNGVNTVDFYITARPNPASGLDICDDEITVDTVTFTYQQPNLNNLSMSISPNSLCQNDETPISITLDGLEDTKTYRVFATTPATIEADLIPYIQNQTGQLVDVVNRNSISDPASYPVMVEVEDLAIGRGCKVNWDPNQSIEIEALPDSTLTINSPTDELCPYEDYDLTANLVSFIDNPEMDVIYILRSEDDLTVDLDTWDPQDAADAMVIPGTSLPGGEANFVVFARKKTGNNCEVKMQNGIVVDVKFSPVLPVLTIDPICYPTDTDYLTYVLAVPSATDEEYRISKDAAGNEVVETFVGNGGDYDVDLPIESARISGGEIVFYITARKNGCNGFNDPAQQITIPVKNQIDNMLVVRSDAPQVCLDETSTITVEASQNGTVYTLLQNNIVLETMTGNGSDLSFSEVAYTIAQAYTYSVEASNDGCIDTLENTVIIDVSSIADLTVDVASFDHCVGEDFDVLASQVIPNMEPGVVYTIKNGVNDIVISDPNDQVLISGADLMSNGFFNITAENSVGNACVRTLDNQLEITIIPLPVIEEADIQICYPDDSALPAKAILSISTLSDTEYYLSDVRALKGDPSAAYYDFAGNGGMVSVEVDLDAADLTNLQKTFYLNARNVGCNDYHAAIDMKEVRVVISPKVDLSLNVFGSDAEICYGGDYSLTIENSQQGVSYDVVDQVTGQDIITGVSGNDGDLLIDIPVNGADINGAVRVFQVRATQVGTGCGGDFLLDQEQLTIHPNPDENTNVSTVAPICYNTDYVAGLSEIIPGYDPMVRMDYVVQRQNEVWSQTLSFVPGNPEPQLVIPAAELNSTVNIFTITVTSEFGCSTELINKLSIGVQSLPMTDADVDEISMQCLNVDGRDLVKVNNPTTEQYYFVKDVSGNIVSGVKEYYMGGDLYLDLDPSLFSPAEQGNTHNLTLFTQKDQLCDEVAVIDFDVEVVEESLPAKDIVTIPEICISDLGSYVSAVNFVDIYGERGQIGRTYSLYDDQGNLIDEDVMRTGVPDPHAKLNLTQDWVNDVVDNWKLGIYRFELRGHYQGCEFDVTNINTVHVFEMRVVGVEPLYMDLIEGSKSCLGEAFSGQVLKNMDPAYSYEIRKDDGEFETIDPNTGFVTLDANKFTGLGRPGDVEFTVVATRVLDIDNPNNTQGHNRCEIIFEEKFIVEVMPDPRNIQVEAQSICYSSVTTDDDGSLVTLSKLEPNVEYFLHVNGDVIKFEDTDSDGSDQNVISVRRHGLRPGENGPFNITARRKLTDTQTCNREIDLDRTVTILVTPELANKDQNVTTNPVDGRVCFGEPLEITLPQVVENWQYTVVDFEGNALTEPYPVDVSDASLTLTVPGESLKLYENKLKIMAEYIAEDYIACPDTLDVVVDVYVEPLPDANVKMKAEGTLCSTTAPAVVELTKTNSSYTYYLVNSEDEALTEVEPIEQGKTLRFELDPKYLSDYNNVFRVIAISNSLGCESEISDNYVVVNRELDREAPEFLDQIGNIYETITGAGDGLPINWREPEAVDNCDPNVLVEYEIFEELTGNKVDLRNGSLFPKNVKYIVRYTAKDASDNTSIMEFIVLVSDETFKNNPPIVRDDVYYVRTNESVDIFPLENDTDPDGDLDPGSFKVVGELPDVGEFEYFDDTKSFTFHALDVEPQELSFFYEVHDSTGNQGQAVVYINVLDVDEVLVHNMFTPNGDGVNDYFVIQQAEKYPNSLLRVYNRYGSKVYEKKGYRNDWDGVSNINLKLGDKVLPEGTYFYIFEKNDGSEPLSGYVYLKP